MGLSRLEGGGRRAIPLRWVRALRAGGQGQEGPRSPPGHPRCKAPRRRPVSCLLGGGRQQRGVAEHGSSVPAGRGGRCWDGVSLRCSPPLLQSRGLPSSLPCRAPLLMEGSFSAPLVKGRGRGASLAAPCGRGGCPLGRAGGGGLTRPCAGVLAGAKLAGSVRPPPAVPVGEGAVVQQGAVFRESAVGRREKEKKKTTTKNPISRVGLSLGTTSGRDAGCGGI